MFTSHVFCHTVQHRFQLRFCDNLKTTSFSWTLYQTSDLGFTRKKQLHLLRCCPGTWAQNWTLSQHTFFLKKNAVLLFNRLKLEEIDGDLMRFEATYEGNGNKVNWPGERSLFLKSDCKVMLLWNKFERLKNGSIGTFKRVLDKDRLLVYFEKVRNVAIEQVTWIKRNCHGEKIAVVHQFPLTPAYTITCHKSQGLKLPAVAVHLSKEFVPGLLYIAMSHVLSVDTLQVIRFSRSQVIPAAPEVII